MMEPIEGRWTLAACHLLETQLNAPLAVTHAGKSAAQVLSSQPQRGGASTTRAAACIQVVRDRHRRGQPLIEGPHMLRTDQRLPSAIRALPDPPYLVHLRGDQQLLHDGRMRVAIVGSRRPRAAAAGITEALARGCAQNGMVVVSGLALGIDGIAHKAALKVGGDTIAVLGCGTDVVYPSTNKRLAEAVAARGLIVSEYAPHVRALPFRFAHRNRIIAALADLVIVVQAAERSGSLITAHRALDLGVPVAVVPGALDDEAFAGTLALLRDGARAIVDARQLSRILRTRIIATDLHQFSRLLETPLTPLEIAHVVEQPLDDILDELMDLEMSGLVTRTMDGRYANR